MLQFDRMRDPIDLAFGIAVLVSATLAFCHAVIYKREPRSAALWAILIWLLPLVGPMLYVLFGVNRVQRRAARLRRHVERHHAAAHPGPAEPEAALAPLARLVGQLTDRPLVAGNAIEALRGGREAYPAMLDAIRGAGRSIALASYIFNRQGIGAQFIAALGEAVARGVEVRVLIDDVDARFSLHSAAGALRRAGVTVGVFNPPFVPARLHAMHLRNHRKILVVDGRTGFTGGMNIAQDFWDAGRGEEVCFDLHFRVRGPVVGQLMEVFADDWMFAAREALRGEPWFPPLQGAGEALARGIECGPDESSDRLRWTLIGALNSARRSVRLATPYFLPDSGLIAALNAAALRGVEVEVLLPERIDLPHVKWAAFAQLWQVLEHGCRVWVRPGAFDHSKLFVVDRAWTLVGSANWDARSLRLNFEFNVECYDRAFGERMDAHLRSRIAGARPVTLAEVDTRPIVIRLRDGVARLFAPLL